MPQLTLSFYAEIKNIKSFVVRAKWRGQINPQCTHVDDTGAPGWLYQCMSCGGLKMMWEKFDYRFDRCVICGAGRDRATYLCSKFRRIKCHKD